VHSARHSGWRFPHRLVSIAGVRSPADDFSYDPAISADGRWVVFYSMASNLVPGDTSNTADVYLRDRTTVALCRDG
jgi:hypothetical protein